MLGKTFLPIQSLEASLFAGALYLIQSELKQHDATSIFSSVSTSHLASHHFLSDQFLKELRVHNVDDADCDHFCSLKYTEVQSLWL